VRGATRGHRTGASAARKARAPTRAQAGRADRQTLRGRRARRAARTAGQTGPRGSGAEATTTRRRPRNQNPAGRPSASGPQRAKKHAKDGTGHGTRCGPAGATRRRRVELEAEPGGQRIHGENDTHTCPGGGPPEEEPPPRTNRAGAEDGRGVRFDRCHQAPKAGRGNTCEAAASGQRLRDRPERSRSEGRARSAATRAVDHGGGDRGTRKPRAANLAAAGRTPAPIRACAAGRGRARRSTGEPRGTRASERVRARARRRKPAPLKAVARLTWARGRAPRRERTGGAREARDARGQQPRDRARSDARGRMARPRRRGTQAPRHHPAAPEATGTAGGDGLTPSARGFSGPGRQRGERAARNAAAEEHAEAGSPGPRRAEEMRAPRRARRPQVVAVGRRQFRHQGLRRAPGGRADATGHGRGQRAASGATSRPSGAGAGGKAAP